LESRFKIRGNIYKFILFLILYKFTDANSQIKGAKMLRDLQEKEGPQNRPDVYDVNSWVVLPQHGKGYYVVNMYSLETNWS
tara:strand:+ start:273 stop:515 length:243 start_codon:yes stop_codon:yes gene_type:complete